MGTPHRAFSTFAPELLFRQPGNHDGQLMRWQGVGVMQNRCDGQVFAAHRPVNHHLQALDRGEHIHRAPIATGAVMV